MNASDLYCGEVSTVELVPTMDPDFGSLVAARTEATIQFSDATGESLLRIGLTRGRSMEAAPEQPLRSNAFATESPESCVGRIGTSKVPE